MKETRRQRRERRKKGELKFILSLLTLLFLLIIVYIFLLSQETSQSPSKVMTSIFSYHNSSEAKEKFSVKEHVILNSKISKKFNLENQVGTVKRVSQRSKDGKTEFFYDVTFLDKTITDIEEKFINHMITKFKIGQVVGYLTGGSEGEEGEVLSVEILDGKEYYTINYKLSGIVTKLTFEDLIYIEELSLKQEASPSDNNKVIQNAIERSKNYAYTILKFPKGRYKIGSKMPDKDYLLLSSNLELVGQETILEVIGSARWFGLATGPEATDGLSNFVMANLTITASDLQNGNQFILMANHGYNWNIFDNTFTMVHEKSSHVFDLGGVQNVIFNRNSFIGYAPELRDINMLGDITSHNVYSEAIQLDASSIHKEWDANLIKKIDKDYVANNPTEILSHNIFIMNNRFLPFRHANGQVIAHSATIGQHSSSVGYAEVYGNYFESPLVNRVTAPSDEEWLFKPIHLQSDNALIYNNEIVP
ncbi:hypothetical protein [Streptococcus fryi]